MVADRVRTAIETNHLYIAESRIGYAQKDFDK
jgi:hypothetical protein